MINLKTTYFQPINRNIVEKSDREICHSISECNALLQSFKLKNNSRL